MSNNKQEKLTQLDEKIAEVRQLLEDLESAARQLREQRQHEAIDELEKIFEETELDFTKFGPLKDEFMDEWRWFVGKIKDNMGL